MVAVVRLQFRLPWQPRQLICRSPDWGLWFELQRRCLRLGLSRTGWFELSCECIESSPLAHWKWAHFASQPDVMGWAGSRATEPFEYKYCVYNRTVFLCHWTIMTGLWQKKKKKENHNDGPSRSATRMKTVLLMEGQVVNLREIPSGYSTTRLSRGDISSTRLANPIGSVGK